MSGTIGGDLPNSAGLAAQGLGASRTIDNTGLSWSGATWAQQLQPGSWRGVGFVLDAGQTKAGRRVAVHEYPYRDTAWAEDVGKLPRRFSIEAFLVGDDVYQQRDAMAAAAEQAGPGTLVHPTLGSVQCVMLDFTATDRRERGRYVELSMSFILAGDVEFPGALIATGAAVLDKLTGLKTASMADLGQTFQAASNAPSTLSTVRLFAQEGQRLAGFTAQAIAAVQDPRRAMGAVMGLVGYYGRYSLGSVSRLLPAAATAATAIADATRGRTNVVNAAQRLLGVAARL